MRRRESKAIGPSEPAGAGTHSLLWGWRKWHDDGRSRWWMTHVTRLTPWTWRKIKIKKKMEYSLKSTLRANMIFFKCNLRRILSSVNYDAVNFERCLSLLREETLTRLSQTITGSILWFMTETAIDCVPEKESKESEHCCKGFWGSNVKQDVWV